MDKNDIFHVLISDDDFHFGWGIQDIIELAWSEFHVSRVSTYDDAIAFITTNPPLHMVISRYSIFNAYHHNFLTKLNESDNYSDIPIIGIARIPEAKEAAIKFGIPADEILLKSFDPEDLLVIIQRVVKRVYDYELTLPNWGDMD